jgi:transposase
LATELARVDDQIAKLDKKLMQLHRSNEMSRRLAAIPGVGPIGATLLSIKVVDARGFKSARNFAVNRRRTEPLELTPIILCGE